MLKFFDSNNKALAHKNIPDFLDRYFKGVDKSLCDMIIDFVINPRSYNKDLIAGMENEIDQNLSFILSDEYIDGEIEGKEIISIRPTPCCRILHIDENNATVSANFAARIEFEFSFLPIEMIYYGDSDTETTYFGREDQLLPEVVDLNTLVEINIEDKNNLEVTSITFGKEEYTVGERTCGDY